MQQSAGGRTRSHRVSRRRQHHGEAAAWRAPAGVRRRFLFHHCNADGTRLMHPIVGRSSVTLEFAQVIPLAHLEDTDVAAFKLCDSDPTECHEWHSGTQVAC